MREKKTGAAAQTAISGKTVQGRQRLPSKEAILAFTEENPAAGKRAIAKAFNLKSDSRQWLGDMLRDLYEDGLLPDRPRQKREKNRRLDALPPIAVLNIVSRNADGILLAEPQQPQRGRKSAGSETPALVALIPALHGKGAAKSGGAAGVGAQVLAKIFPSKGEDKQIAPYQGRIIRILSREPATQLGIVRRGAQGFFLEPADRRQKELRLPAEALNGAAEGDLALAEPQSGRPHFGRIKQRLGADMNEAALSAIALYTHNIPDRFAEAVLAEARGKAAQNPAAELNSREDWRKIPFITIDPETAKDHDDAVFAEADTDSRNQGGHIIRIAIADVAAYVRPASALDSEARRRGNSVYFPNRVVPMLPEEISNNLCSLREGEDRPALAAKITLNGRGQMLRHSFHRVLIRSAAKLSYSQAQAAIDGQTDSKTAPLLDSVLRPLWAAYAGLKTAREARQPLELNLPERKLFLDEDGRISDIRAVPKLDAHRLIEEFMIAANIAAAETLKNRNKPLLFRIHDSPSPAKQESLREFLHGIGLKLGSGAEISAARLNGILAKAAGRDYEEMVNQVVLRAQAQAEYSPDNIGHFGLKLRHYAHFTSPIRRYADLLVHRGLIKALGLGEDGITQAEEAALDIIGAEISAAERRAQAAERETNDRLIAHYLNAHIGAHFHGRISGVTRAGLFITLDKTGADGLAPIASLKNKEEREYYHFDEAHFALIGERSRKGYQLGDAVEVRLLEVQKAAGSLRFELLSAPKKLPFSGKSFHKAVSRRRPQKPFRGKPR